MFSYTFASVHSKGSCAASAFRCRERQGRGWPVLGDAGNSDEFESFTQLGVVPEDPAVQDNGEVLLPKTQEKAVVHRREFPMNNAVVTFP